MEMNIKKAREIAETNKNPFYLFDFDIFEARIKMIEEGLKGSAKVCYAMKANPFLTGVAANVLDRIEVCSYGEYEICRDLKIPAEKLLISGVLKKKEDLDKIISEADGRCIFTVESWNQFLQLKEASRVRKINIIIRLTNKSQFGVNKEDILEMIKESMDVKDLNVKGIHYFSGTQKKHPDKDKKELLMLDELIKEIKESTGHDIEELEYGPGIPYSYFEGKDVLPMEDFLDTISNTINEMEFGGSVTIELGRAIAAVSGCYCTRVLDVKKNIDTDYLMTDGGIHQLAYDGQIKGMYHPFMEVVRDHEDLYPEKVWTVCGSLCTMNDVLTANIKLGDVRVGDALIFKNAGAYSFAEGMALFLSHELPDVYGYSVKEGLKVMRKDVLTYPFNTVKRS